MPPPKPPVVLFGYDSSPFTQKVRLSLRIKQIPYTFIPVPSMMPRPILKDNFSLSYRKIPVLLIGRDMYCDTSLIIEALEDRFSAGHPSLYPPAADGRNYRPIIRGFASYWTDRPIFRTTTGLIPPSVWNSQFGTDRANLIGHKLNPEKLGAKVTENKGKLDMQLSILEPLFSPAKGDWIFSTRTPSLADISLYYQLDWGSDMARGRGLANLSAGELEDTDVEGVEPFFNERRYPGLTQWMRKFGKFVNGLPGVETRADDPVHVLAEIKRANKPEGEVALVSTPAEQLRDYDEKCGLVNGALVSVAPDDTGRSSPTVGKLVALSTEELVIAPEEEAKISVNIHFPRLGFDVRPVSKSKL